MKYKPASKIQTNASLPSNWHGKPYYSLDAYCKNTFRHKCYKIALNAHMTCPNRDGSLGTRGCIFCSCGGSGDFAVSTEGKSMEEQIRTGLTLFGSKETGRHFIAYFQAYTNTYAPVAYLETVYRQALDHPQICGISIATRPDCIPDEVLDLLCRLRTDYPDKFIWIELGLQTIHERTAAFLRRGYPLSCFDDCFQRLKSCNIPVIVHVILGLPGEDREKLLETIQYLNRLIPFGIKLQLLHILKDTDLAWYYQCEALQTLSKEEYLELLTDCLVHLSPDIVVHRVTGDGPKELLIAPLWSCNKRDVLNSLHKKMRDEDLFQGKCFSPS
ncbi:MAG: TIGR01212 family radical SAM protein [Lachnospiraceae bacterium]|nr:TIGR01212 family radical SAM protein [Lachnospiraceae bacterium]